MVTKTNHYEKVELVSYGCDGNRIHLGLPTDRQIDSQTEQFQCDKTSKSKSDSTLILLQT